MVATVTNIALMAGGLNSFGNFQPHIVDLFEATVADVAWAATFANSSLSIFGIISGILIDRCDVSKVMFAGGIFSFCGMFGMVFATDVLQLTIFIGVVLGFGQCLVFNSVISSISYMFCSEKFDLYLGITLCGISFGTTVFSILTENGEDDDDFFQFFHDIDSANENDDDDDNYSTKRLVFISVPPEHQQYN
ncbi:fujikurins efflux protein FFUJ_12242-like [Anneissia japonica]|uniref:fujikurins efflux protein FFUJ_12242-like n=1 Tax=Anneissia japonica TaxID=1529436 RepID=UPI0014256E1A|nr:fujikurins efflux protein FFUJ_12242-like [Anneissia japonica]